MYPPPSQLDRVRLVVRDLEGPIVYSLTVLAASVGILVYGATKINSGRRGALLDNLQPIFGVPYALAVLAILVAVLALGRRWKGLIVVAVLYGLFLALSLSSPASRPFAWNEYLALSASLSCLVTSGLVYYHVLD